MPDPEIETARPDPEHVTGTSTTRGEERLVHCIRMLSDEDENNRWTAAESLGRLGDEGAVDLLIDMLWDDNARVRRKAAGARGRIGDIRAIGPLRHLYHRENEETREIITKAIDQINLKVSQQ